MIISFILHTLDETFILNMTKNNIVSSAYFYLFEYDITAGTEKKKNYTKKMSMTLEKSY